MASAGNQHCANCIGTLSFPICHHTPTFVKSPYFTWAGPWPQKCSFPSDLDPHPVVKVDRRIRWHYTTTILRLRIGARLTRYRNCKFHNFARTISRYADGISRYSVPPSASPLLPLPSSSTGFRWSTQVCPNGISIGSAAFAQRSAQTRRPRYVRRV